MNSPTSSGGSRSSSLAGATGRLVAISVYTVAAALVLWQFESLPSVVRIPLALPVILFTPGYAVTAALLPPRPGADDGRTGHRAEEGLQRGLTSLERIVLSVVASVAVVPMVAFAMEPVTDIHAGPILAALAGVTVLASVVGVFRVPSRGVAADRSVDRFDAQESDSSGSWRHALTDGVTLLAVALTAILLVSSAALAFTGGSDGAPRTEFYVADGDGAAGDPGDGAQRVFDLRIQHHAADERPYTVVVMTGSADAASGSSGSLTERDRFAVDVGPNEVASETYRIGSSAVDGDSTAVFLLYRGDAPSDPDPESAHRYLRLSLNATAS